MRIKSNKRNWRNPVSIVFMLVLGVLVVAMIYGLKQDRKKMDDTQKEVLSFIDDANNIDLAELDIPTLVGQPDKALYKKNAVSVYGVIDNNLPKLLYIYKGNLNKRATEDKFYLHVYLKDSTQFHEPFVNLVFTNLIPDTISIGGMPYHVFTLDLEHRRYDNYYIPFEAIKYLNTGRFTVGKGRSFEVEKMVADTSKVDRFVTKLRLNRNGSGKEAIYSPQKIAILTEEKAMQKIRAKREEALKKGILVTGDEDLQKGEISGDLESFQKMEFRLKGDWTDHIEDPVKWSYRITMKGSSSFNGMRKFSIQHPKTRNYQWEWLFNKVVKQHDIIGLRYEFVEVEVAVKNNNGIERIDYGLMALEESFDKILIENNKKREGIILGFDEALLWQDRQQQLKYNLDLSALDEDLASAEYAPIKVYNQNKILSDENLSRQLDIAKDLLDGVRKGIYQPSEVFDLDKLTDYVALSNLFGSYHGLVWHNLRIYYNPVTNKLEPICFDTNSGLQLEEIKHFPFTKNDSVYQEMMLQKLERFSQLEYVNSILDEHGPLLNDLIERINDDYAFIFDPRVLQYNSNYIKKTIYPGIPLTASYLEMDERELKLQLQNVTDFPIEIVRLEHRDGKRLDQLEAPVVLGSRQNETIAVTLDSSFDNAFVSKKSKKGGFRFPKDLQNLRLVTRIAGMELEREIEVQAFGSNPEIDTSIAAYRRSESSNYSDFDFIKPQADGSLAFLPGNHILEKSLIIAEDITISIEAGFRMDMLNQSSIIHKGNLVARGSSENPIEFYSSDGSARGIFVNGSNRESFLDYCVFTNLSNPVIGSWSLSGAVNFNETVVHIDNSRFISNRCEDALNIIRSEFTLTNSLFEQTFSDSFDGDFVTGTVQNCIFRDSGNDGVDVSGSNIELIDLLIENPSDKAISAGEASTMKGNNIKIISGEIGVVSKDLSTIDFDGVEVTDTRLGLSAFQKKSEYGVAKISINNLVLNNVEKDHLIELNSELRIDNKLMETVSNKVIEQMYGNEYGKSSK